MLGCFSSPERQRASLIPGLREGIVELATDDATQARLSATDSSTLVTKDASINTRQIVDKCLQACSHATINAAGGLDTLAATTDQSQSYRSPYCPAPITLRRLIIEQETGGKDKLERT